VPPEKDQAPDPTVVKVNVVQLPPGPQKDAGWWISTTGPLVIGALALIVAFSTLVIQRQGNQNAQAAINSAAASDVSVNQVGKTADFEIENLAHSGIHSVWLQPAPPPGLVGLLPIGPCSMTTVTLTTASKPVVYFVDSANRSWKIVNGVLQPAANPSAVIDLLAPGIRSSIVSGQLDVNPVTRPAPGCP
jgi:hypothetical protein